jgi:hypothetical protein
LLAELSAHLETLAASYEELGSTPESAVILALQQFGEPRHLSRQWIREWTRPGGPAGPQPAWRAMLIGLGCFGSASVMAFLMLAVESSGWEHGPQRGMIMEMLFVGVLSPLLAGLVTGLLAPARHVLGTFFALALVIVPTAALGLLVPGHVPESGGLGEYGIALAMIQSVCWMPIGCATAALGGWLQSRLAFKPHQWVLQ